MGVGGILSLIMIVRTLLALFVGSLLVFSFGCATEVAEEQEEPATSEPERQDPAGMEGAFDIDK